jgi:hypothetical protein
VGRMRSPDQGGYTIEDGGLEDGPGAVKYIQSCVGKSSLYVP